MGYLTQEHCMFVCPRQDKVWMESCGVSCVLLKMIHSDILNPKKIKQNVDYLYQFGCTWGTQTILIRYIS